MAWKSSFRQNYQTFLAHSSTFRRWVLLRGNTWRGPVAKVGTCNQDRSISLKAAVRSCTNNNKLAGLLCSNKGRVIKTVMLRSGYKSMQLCIVDFIVKLLLNLTLMQQ